jgi:ribosomal protein S18 acetylase RimI-like enzyme
MTGIVFTIDPVLDPAAFARLVQAAWGGPPSSDLGQIHQRSLGWIGAYADDRLVGYVNIAWDGGQHAFVLDTTVDPAHQRQGIGQALVRQATELARARGARWLHVDFEPHLAGFYLGSGFRPTEAGLIDLSA